MGYMEEKENGAIGHSLREHGKAHGLLCQSTPCECVSAPIRVQEKERDRQCKCNIPYSDVSFHIYFFGLYSGRILVSSYPFLVFG
jgi:NADH:ubiquinone oxidoreductase subunit H